MRDGRFKVTNKQQLIALRI